VGLVLANNADMLALMKRLGFTEQNDPDDSDLKQVIMQLAA
jgi:hypothetical protein